MPPRWRQWRCFVGFVLALGVVLPGADAPVSFGADTLLSLDWAKDDVDGAIVATKPPRIKAPQTVRIFMLASKLSASDNDKTSDR